MKEETSKTSPDVDYIELIRKLESICQSVLPGDLSVMACALVRACSVPVGRF